MDFPTQLKTFKNFCAKHSRITKKVIEDQANGAALIATVKNEIAGVVAYNPRTSKEDRVQAVSPEVEAGNVYIPDPSIAPWVGDFVEECAAFPKGANDDQVDMFTQALLSFQQDAAGSFAALVSKNQTNASIKEKIAEKPEW
jgi:predicted phage terminase large subunit-like protein